MRTRLILLLALSLGLAACAGGMPKRPAEPDGVAFFDAAELAVLSQASCEAELARSRHGQAWWLCGYGWRPAAEPGAERSVESYRLFWVRAAEPRVVMRIARYEDGSGALWVTADERPGPGKEAPHMRVTTFKAADFAPLFGRLSQSPLWASSFARMRDEGGEPAKCKIVSRWILEGRQGADHRAVSVQSCGEGRWAVDLGTDMLKFARTKMPDLPMEPLY